MEKKTEYLKTELSERPLIWCETCNASQPHKIIASHFSHTQYVDDKSDVAMQIIRCETCERVSFRSLSAGQGFHVKNSEGVWVDPVTEVRYVSRPLNNEWRVLSPDESTGIFD
jgi:hypothetical protein